MFVKIEDTVELMLNDDYIERLKGELAQTVIRYNDLTEKLCNVYLGAVLDDDEEKNQEIRYMLEERQRYYKGIIEMIKSELDAYGIKVDIKDFIK